MNIKKIGHCCLLIKIENITILTDPGTYSTGQDEEKDIDLILITHEHPDHLHIDSLKKVLKNNPQAQVITNSSVGKILSNKKIKCEILEDQQSIEKLGIKIEGFGEKHALMHKSLEPVDNTGYFINNLFFYPGDAFINPNRSIEILALPVAGPWMKLSEAIDYAIELKPKTCFPVHDAILKSPGSTHSIPQTVLKTFGINFIIINEIEDFDF